MEEKEVVEIELFSSSNEYEINQICSVLTENNIPFIRKNDGSGSYMNLYMGQSIQEKRILVNKKDYEKAMELISSFISNKEGAKEDLLDTSDKYTLIRRCLGFLILGMPIVILLVMIVVSLL